MDKIYDQLSNYAICEKDKSLSNMTTLHIGGKVKYVVYPKTDFALVGILEIIRENHLNYKMIGKGSDLLCSDKDYDGVSIYF